MTQELWTPSGTIPLGVAPVGRNAETGGKIVAHMVMLKVTDRFGVEHKQKVQVLADDTTSQSQIEEMMGNAAESFVEQVRTKYNKRPPTELERKEIGRALNEFRKYASKRITSTNRKIYH